MGHTVTRLAVRVQSQEHSTGKSGGQPLSSRFGDDGNDGGSLCWEIVRALLIVAGILTIILGGAYYASGLMDATIEDEL
jgi:hypothetical protein